MMADGQSLNPKSYTAFDLRVESGPGVGWLLCACSLALMLVNESTGISKFCMSAGGVCTIGYLGFTT